MNAQVKKYGTIALVALGSMMVLNTLAKRFGPAATLKDKIDQGL